MSFSGAQGTPRHKRGLGRENDGRVEVLMDSEGVARNLVVHGGSALSDGSLLLFCLPPRKRMLNNLRSLPR
jgi:hypothetical protein